MEKTERPFDKNAQIAFKIHECFLKILGDKILPYSDMFLTAFVFDHVEYNLGNICTIFWRFGDDYDIPKVNLLILLFKPSLF